MALALDRTGEAPRIPSVPCIAKGLMLALDRAGEAPLIRAYHPNDAGPCTGIFRRAWHHGHPYAPRVIDRSTFLQETRNETLLVAEPPGGPGVAGFVAVFEPEAFVHHLYVEPSRHGFGLGRRLLEAAATLVGERRLSLKCQTRNEAAMLFYGRLGWTEGETGEGWVRLWAPQGRGGAFGKP